MSELFDNRGLPKFHCKSSRESKAQADGRFNPSGVDNPHAAGTPEHGAYAAGFHGRMADSHTEAVRHDQGMSVSKIAANRAAAAQHNAAARTHDSYGDGSIHSSMARSAGINAANKVFASGKR